MVFVAISVLVGISVPPEPIFGTVLAKLSIPFGSADPRLFFSRGRSTSPTGDLVTNAIVANIPQVFLSLIYYSYNSLLTLFFLAYE